MDQITTAFLKEFSSFHGFDQLKLELQFEHFCNYCTLSAECGELDIDVQDMFTGESNQGIDGIAINVNGATVSSIDDIQRLITQNHRLDVKFIFVQTKTSENFDNKEIGNFLAFVENFFKDDADDVFSTEEMANFIDMRKYIFDNSKYMSNSNPSVKLYYVALGKWDSSDKSLNSVVRVSLDNMNHTNLFSDVSFIPCGSQEIQNMYRKSRQDISASFVFSKNVMLFDNNDSYAYSGVLPFSEFKKIICDDNDSLKAVFEDNIRDFLGENNSVNSDIESSINRNDAQIFCMLNNGITVVAHSSTGLVGEKMTINDYQIVNGCQTSHVLYLNRTRPEINSLLIPIRIIVTQDEELKNRITKATNYQTGITKEQLEALSSFQKSLESYYSTVPNHNHLYYERRIGQYRGKDIPSCQIVSIRNQIKVFSAMFNEKPHDSAGHYSLLLKDVGSKIFRPTDQMSLYYASALALYKFEGLIKAKIIDQRFRKSKYHVIMLLKYSIDSNVPKYYNAKKAGKFAEKMIEILNDPELSNKYFLAITNYISSIKELELSERKLFERKETTEILLKNRSELLKMI